MNLTVTRFAPSPTGYMHIGNLRTALYSYLLAKANDGRFILRIEDTDQMRYVEGATEIIYKTLTMSGIAWDEGPIVGGDHGPYIQSERKPIYMEYAKKLIESGNAYYCFCTTERLQQLHDESGIGGYDRHCRNLSSSEINQKLSDGVPYVIRQKIPLEGKTSFVDEVYGEVEVNNQELQDQILIKADGYPTYNFAHVVDDYLMGVTHVVRGNEYLASTPKYCLLYDAFGWERPHYVHLPLLMGKDEEGKVSKLSKRHGAVSFQALVEMGYLPEAIINYIALLGWNPKDNREMFSIEELKKAFSLEALNKSSSIFDYEKLKWFNSEYIKALPFEKFYTYASPILSRECPSNVDIEKLAKLLHTRISTFGEIKDQVQFACNILSMDLSLYSNKKNKTSPEVCKDILMLALPALKGVGDWSNDSLFNAIKEFSAKAEIKIGAVMWAIRIAVARQGVTPGGASEIMEILGKEESIHRIEYAINELSAQN